MRYGREIAFGLAVAAVGAVLWLWLTQTTTSPAPRASGADVPRPAGEGAARPGAGGADEVASAEDEVISGRPDAKHPVGGRPISVDIPPDRIAPSTRPFDSPATASRFVEEKVVDLLVAVDPSFDAGAITRDCSADGRVCTFHGPWPGDDFMRQWLAAISEGRTGTDALDGVRFSRFKPIGEGEEREFEIVAHAP